MASRNDEVFEELEDAVDALGLADVLAILSDVCNEKADHIQSSYATSRAKDPDAREWERAADAIIKVANKVNV